MNFKKNTFVIAVHEAFASGIGQDLKKYFLLNNVGRLLFISHPLTYQKAYLKNSSRFEYFFEGKILRSHTAIHWVLPEFLLYIKDFLYTQYWCFKMRRKIDVFWALDPLNAFSGLFLKKLGLAGKVVYYSIDYFPQRFKNRILNSIYHLMDKICVKYLDETWNISPTMVDAREERGMKRERYSRQHTVPVCIWFKRTKRRRFDMINKKKIVYVGLVDKNAGLDLIIKALPQIIKKVPGVSLEIMGSGPEEELLRKQADKSGILKHIIFHGIVKERERVEEILSYSAVGLATFNPITFGREVKNADPMKIKDYMLFGLPPIVTNCLATADAIRKAKCGIIIRFRAQELVDAITELLGNEKILKSYRKNAVKYVSQFDFEKVYGENIQRVLSA